MTQLSKLQIRAKVLSVISEIKTLRNFNEDAIAKYKSELEQISDKKALFDIFLKEFVKMQEAEYIFSACLLKEIVPEEYINSKVLEELKSSSLSDEYKYKLVQLLRITGGTDNFSEIPSYFDNPEEILDLETKKLLEKAVVNPEAMLDFLDFVSAVSQNDRNLLLNSLSQDYTGDELANIIYPILYSGFDDSFILDCVKILINSRSSLAIAPFEYLIKTSNNEDIVNNCRLGLKQLKFAGASKENADKYFNNIIKDSSPAEFFTTIPDGAGNQALLISRVTSKGKYHLSAVVINDVSGIIDCFGFYNISPDELYRVIDKFYQTEGKYKVPAEYAKTKIQTAVDITIKQKRKFPYEFICWNVLLNDVNLMADSLENIISKKSSAVNISKDEILTLLTKDFTLRWFISPSENDVIKKMVDVFYNMSDIDISFINQEIKNKFNTIFDDNSSNIWQSRLYNLIYLLQENSYSNEADCFYTIVKNNEYFNLFKYVLIQRSIFNHFISLRELCKESLLATNIFRKKNLNEQKHDIKKIDNLIKLMKKSWIDG